MSSGMTAKKAVGFIENRGVLLVYPLDNRKAPRSLWSEFFPRSEMRWEWDTGGDDRVADLWRLREELSRSGKVVYAKWFRGRATFFSREVFTDLLAGFGSVRMDRSRLTREARLLLETLESDSPLSTKQLKAATDLRGKLFESTYEKAMRELWRKLLIVGHGELDDGAFPSLLVGATRHHFEDLWDEARGIDRDTAFARVYAKFEADPPFRKFLDQVVLDGSSRIDTDASN
ncbi:MAG: hypothetical protein JST04_10750 [Bdellovibrionales bacterium]|nr:hypothetical protein [Bdellovibrionales bacterium]